MHSSVASVPALVITRFWVARIVGWTGTRSIAIVQNPHKQLYSQWTWTMILLLTGDGTPFWAMQRYAPPSARASLLSTSSVPSIPSSAGK